MNPPKPDMAPIAADHSIGANGTANTGHGWPLRMSNPATSGPPLS